MGPLARQHITAGELLQFIERDGGDGYEGVYLLRALVPFDRDTETLQFFKDHPEIEESYSWEEWVSLGCPCEAPAEPFVKYLEQRGLVERLTPVPWVLNYGAAPRLSTGEAVPCTENKFSRSYDAAIERQERLPR
jgi:hypothetical protein